MQSDWADLVNEKISKQSSKQNVNHYLRRPIYDTGRTTGTTSRPIYDTVYNTKYNTKYNTTTYMSKPIIESRPIIPDRKIIEPIVESRPIKPVSIIKKEYKINNMNIIIVNSDLEECLKNNNVEVIVNAANPYLVRGGCFSRSLYELYLIEGIDIHQLVYKILHIYPNINRKLCNYGDCILLKHKPIYRSVKALIEAVGPDDGNNKYGKYNNFEECLKNTYINCMNKIINGNYKSVIFPCISGGIYRGSQKFETIAKTVYSALYQIKNWNGTVILNCYNLKDNTIYNTYINIFDELINTTYEPQKVKIIDKPHESNEKPKYIESKIYTSSDYQWPIENDGNNDCLFEAMAAYFYFSINEEDCVYKTHCIMEKVIKGSKFNNLINHYKAAEQIYNLALCVFNSSYCSNINDDVHKYCANYKYILDKERREQLYDLNLIQDMKYNDNSVYVEIHHCANHYFCVITDKNNCIKIDSISGFKFNYEPSVGESIIFSRTYTYNEKTDGSKSGYELIHDKLNEWFK
jgi:O-acetyl-ADP-ribose deacetylase (regulator of RNase III)